MTNERLKELQTRYLEKPCAEPLRSDIAELIDAVKGEAKPKYKSPSKQFVLDPIDVEGH